MYRQVPRSSSSETSEVGRVRASSMAVGLCSEHSKGSFLIRFAGETTGRASSPAALFLLTRFAAVRICLACFSSGKRALIVAIETFAKDSGLTQTSAQIHPPVVDIRDGLY